MKSLFSLLLALSVLALAAYIGPELLRPERQRVKPAAAGVVEPVAELKGARGASRGRPQVTRTGDATGEEKVTVPALCDGNELRTGHCDESELRAVYERYGRPPWIGFQLETRNDVWAAATEATLLDGVAQIPGLPTITSIGVECRESLCRLVITFPLQDSSGGGRPSNNVLGFAGDYLIPIFERVGLRTLRIDPRGTDASMVTYYLGP